MNARTRLNFVLLIAVIVLAAGLWWLPAPENNGEKDNPPLADLNPAAVESLRIETGSRTVHLARNEAGWRLTAPFAAPADDTAVFEIIRSLNTDSHAAYNPEGLKLAEYGLDEPSATITVDDARFAFGRLEPLSRRRYVLHDGRIHLIGNTTFYRLKRQPTELVAKRPIPESATPETLALPEFTLERNDQGGWNIRPEQPEVGADQLQRLADRWQRARAIRVRQSLPDNAEPAGTIRITRKEQDGSPLTFRAFDQNGKLLLEAPSGEFVRDMGPGSTGRLLLVPAPKEEKTRPEATAESAPGEPAGTAG